MCGAQPEYRQRLLGPYDDSPEKAADAKYGIVMAYFDKVEEPEVDEAAHDFPSTELLQATFKITKFFGLILCKKAIALTMAAFDGFRLLPKTVQPKEDEEGDELRK